MARDRRLWINGKEENCEHTQRRYVSGFQTKPESIRICLPSGFAGMLRRDKSGCGSFWLKEEYSSVGVFTRYAFFQKFFLSYQKSSATRQMRIFRGCHKRQAINPHTAYWLSSTGTAIKRRIISNRSTRRRSMNGTIAQLVTLTCYGNAFLSGQATTQFYSTNSTFLYCEQATFVTIGTTFLGKPKETEIAHDPGAWFTYLKGRGANGFRLARAPQNKPGISDRMTAGFVGGGGDWTIEVILPKGESEHWMPRWEVGNQKALDKRIWRVTYGRISTGKTVLSPAPELSKAIQELHESLKDVRLFSVQQKLDVFIKLFDEALDTIESKGEKRHGYHQDLAPQGFLSAEAGTILDACQKAWVFGGMGSWNDMGFDGEDQKTYDRVSERLFQAVNTAIAQAATSTMKDGLTTGGR